MGWVLKDGEGIFQNLTPLERRKRIQRALNDMETHQSLRQQRGDLTTKPGVLFPPHELDKVC